MIRILIFMSILSPSVFAAGNKGTPGPCEQIELDCKANHYAPNEAKQGKGLWWDCMCPLIAPNFPEPANNVLTVPSDANLVPACRQHPRGQRIMARCAEMQAKKKK